MQGSGVIYKEIEQIKDRGSMIYKAITEIDCKEIASFRRLHDL